MIVPVKMLAFDFDNEQKTRLVDLGTGSYGMEPDLNVVLNKTFELGQNDFQPQDMPSVSIGDVILFNGYHRVGRCGFTEMTLEEYEEYLKIDYRDRFFWNKGE
jgi:hypothetical protein